MNGYDAVEVKDGIKKIKLLVNQSCPHCETLKKKLKTEIDSGKIELIDTDSPYGNRLADELGINEIPAFVGVVEHEDGSSTICKLGDKLQIEKCTEESA